MPREHRKRGQRKKTRKEGEESQEIQATSNAQTDRPSATHTQPSWIEDAPEAPVVSETDFDAPWGYVDPDVKAYFRTVEEQMLEWQSTGQLQRDGPQMGNDLNEGKMRLVLFRRSWLSTPLLRTPTIFRRRFAGNARQRVTAGNRPGLFWYTRTYDIFYGRPCSTTLHRELLGVVGVTYSIRRGDTECPPLQIPPIDYSSICLPRGPDIPHHCCQHHHTRNSGHLP